jgi:hypothetical protein
LGLVDIKIPYAGGDTGPLLLVYRSGEKPANEAIQNTTFLITGQDFLTHSFANIGIRKT